MFINEQIEVNQEWQGKQVSFDPDSSPKAWENYQKYYDKEFLKNYNYNDLITFDFKEVRENKGYYAVNEYLRDYNRLNILPIDYIMGNECSTLAVQRLSGETDFNFNDKKYDEFIQLLKLDKNNYTYNLNMLDKCFDMHHTLLNFSIMPAMGNLQTAKSVGLQNEWLDRLDRFVYMLDLYYKTEQTKRENSIIIKTIKEIKKNISQNNIQAVVDYLNSFDKDNDSDNSIYNYCKTIYFIDKSLVDKLINSGKMPLDSAQRIVEYMNLAMEFWDEKEFYFLKNEYSIIGDYFPNGGETYSHEELLCRLKTDLQCTNDEAQYLIEKCIERSFIIDCGNDCYTR